MPAGVELTNSSQLIPWGEKVLEVRWRVEKSGKMGVAVLNTLKQG